MTLLNDELQYVCAWGRWRIGQALNEPVLAWSGERRLVEFRARARVAKVQRKVRAGRARLRLVAGTALCDATLPAGTR